MKCDFIPYQIYNYPINYPQKTNSPSFSGRGIPQAVSDVNIGMLPAGFIGKIKVRLAEGGDAILNVFKRFGVDGIENYKVKNDYNELIGEMDLKVRKITTYDPYTYKEDPSHVYVDMLKNYTRPGTPDYNGVTYHKDLGLRLLQIAQKRSDEARCNGNIRLNAKGEAKDWYINYIGMVPEPSPTDHLNLRIRLNNPNMLHLPPHSKEPLSRLQGGL